MCFFLLLLHTGDGFNFCIQAIDKSEPATLPSKRIQNIIDHLTYEIYLYIQRGLFERHKLLFALMLTNRVMQSAGTIRAADVDVFLKGGGALDITSVRKKPKEWIPDSVWLSVIALSQMDAFRDIPDSVFRNDGLWKQWYALYRLCVPAAGTRLQNCVWQTGLELSTTQSSCVTPHSKPAWLACSTNMTRPGKHRG